MWGRAGQGSRRAALLAWLVFASVAWNVVFDRQVAVAGARFVQASVERHQAGRPFVTIARGYRPEVSRAAWQASLWAGAILAAGLAASSLGAAARTGGRPGR